ncbi:GTPase involved in ribosome synthesis and maintenance [Candidatus Filomicrobium marinum]|uniref:GTPase Der n=2 Tax=Filomicrobium TaxID=119044 RepID=A0A0D6J9N9_9HYPH|nr:MULTISPECIES: ribosome biogenesis GTPase Der [Filomicrobium]MCV0368862.1 ribosome biogenesis GTPase Der [Filomicrobium sp.]CFW97627.1 GTPase involved in ribosome synthesis and maintenance [Candidatus Filomicrobium marinum]CPR14724.1 GTPase involved in ribosome synthesis and maintenance [Candidatus Filomicrobium marinum]SDO76533.1 GTP-binding protein [Filomicrobium insigne]
MADQISTNAPAIAIVGRPNVGKSTLFNRLTGRRTALVSDMPGLTRDRRDGVADFGSHTVRIIDTAGLEEAGAGSIESRMREQSQRAIELADVVLFVIDARDGVTEADKAFAQIVRRSGRPTILVANKCEGRAGQDGFFEGFELGLGAPVPISAEHGEGIADLVDDVMSALGLEANFKTRKGERGSEPEVADLERPLRVAIVGRPNAGKSTLVNALLGEDRMITGPEPGLTRDTISSDVTINGRSIRLFDTAGLRRKAKINELAEKLSASDTIRAIRFAEVVVLMIDAERPFEHQDLTIGDMVTQEGRALVIAVNKWDLVTDKQAQLKALRETVNERLSQVPGVKLVMISALAERGLDKLTHAIFETYATWNRRIGTPDLNRWLQEALARHAPPAAAGRRIKIRFITQPSARPPTFIAFCSRPDELPRSYLRYLTNSLRSAFDLPGVPIRLNLRKGENPYAPSKKR